MSTFKDNPWARRILGVLFRDDAGDDIGRSDIVNLGSGLEVDWDSTNEELTLTANAGFFISETPTDVAVTSGAGVTTVLDYDLSAIVTAAGVAIADGQSILIDVRVEAWRGSAVDTAGYCDFTAHVVYHTAGSGGSSVLNDPTVEQVISSSWEGGLVADCTIVSNTTFRVTCESSITSVRCNALLSHRGPRTRSPTP